MCDVPSDWRSTLDDEQKHQLAEVIGHQAGPDSGFETFCDCLSALCEDIPGFETQAPAEALVREIWNLYRHRTISMVSGKTCGNL